MIIHIHQTHNSRPDSLARNSRIQPSFVVQIDSEFPVWFPKFHESVYIDDKKKIVYLICFLVVMQHFKIIWKFKIHTPAHMLSRKSVISTHCLRTYTRLLLFDTIILLIDNTLNWKWYNLIDVKMWSSKNNVHWWLKCDSMLYKIRQMTRSMIKLKLWFKRVFYTQDHILWFNYTIIHFWLLRHFYQLKSPILFLFLHSVFTFFLIITLLIWFFSLSYI